MKIKWGLNEDSGLVGPKSYSGIAETNLYVAINICCLQKTTLNVNTSGAFRPHSFISGGFLAPAFVTSEPVQGKHKKQATRSAASVADSSGCLPVKRALT